MGFITGQLNSLKLQNHRPTAGVAAVAVAEAPKEDKPKDKKQSIKSLRGKLKAAKQKLKKKQEKKATKKNQSDKFSRSNSGAYIPLEEWKKLSDEEKAAARAARHKAGIPTRKVGAVASKPKLDDGPGVEVMHKSWMTDAQLKEEQEGEESWVIVDPHQVTSKLSKVKAVPKTVPAALLTAPKRGLVTTQRDRRVHFQRTVKNDE